MFFKKPDDEENAKKVATPMATSSAAVRHDKPVTSSSPSNSAPLSTSASDSFEESISKRFGRLRSALGAGTVIQGKLSFDTVVSIDGKLSGEVASTETLIVGKHGQINAQLQVKTLIVGGFVQGNVCATESIELLRGGRIEGDITAPRIVIEDGSIFNGSCKMTPQLDKQPVTGGGAGKTESKPLTAVAPTELTETALSAIELKAAALGKLKPKTAEMAPEAKPTASATSTARP